MIYSLSGTLLATQKNSAIVGVHGVGLKVATTERTLRSVPKIGEAVSFFTHLHVREDALDLFGFLTEPELKFFELLISVSGVGPKSALSVMDIEEFSKLAAAIQEGRPDLLTRASGIGRKTAERIILELRGKVEAINAGKVVERMEGDTDLVDALVNLGYKRPDVRDAISKIDQKLTI